MTAAPIHRASETGDLAKVQALLEKEPNLVNAKGDNGKVPLHFAAAKGHVDIAALLIAKGGDTNAKDEDGEVPLHLAAANGQVELASLLIAQGADVNARSVGGSTPLRMAAEEGRAQMVSLLVEKGADVKAKAATGWTPLHGAAENGYTDVASFLVLKGADVDAKEEKGRTPLRWASLKGHMEIVSLLVAAGANVNAREEDGDTPLFAAILGNQAAVVSYLLSKGATVNAVNNYGWTPLHAAALGSHAKIVSLLLEKGADINAKTKKGETPLHFAESGKITQTITLLVAKGARPIVKVASVPPPGQAITAVPKHLLIKPGRSVGRINLGAGRKVVWQVMGKPSKTVRRTDGFIEDRWIVPNPRDKSDYPPSISVIFRKDKALQIEFGAPQFATSSGFSMRNSLAQFREKRPSLQVKAYGYTFYEGGEPAGGHVSYYYDDVQGGIAFEVSVQDYFDARTTPSSLRIHLPGQPVLIDPGGKPIKAVDEVPVGSMGR